MSSLEQLVFEIIARDRNASKAFDSFRRSVDNSSTSVDKNTASLDKNTQAQTSAMGGAVSLGAAFSAMTSPLAAAGAGVAAFGALAAPSVMKVSKALSGPGGLTAAWGTLDNRQRNMALGVQTLGHRFAGLAAAMEPRTAQVFTTALGVAGGALGPFGQLAANAGTALEGFLTQFSQQSGLNKFISFMSREAGPAISLLGTDITNIARSVFALLQSWGGLGLAELKAVTFVISGVTGSLTWLATHAPGITSAAIAIGGVALALSKLGLLSGVLKITGIAAISGQMTGFMAATKGATLAEKGLLATTTALDAINPFVWVAAAAVAVGVLVDKIVTFKGSVADMVSELAKQNQATGLNVAGYQKLSGALVRASTNYGQMARTLTLGRGAQGGLTDETTAYTSAARRAAQMAVTLRGDFRTLGERYGITAGQAKGLIVHAGAVNDILKAGGRITPQAARMIDAYARANERAQNPTSQLAADLADYSNKTLTATTRTTALTNALKLFFDPAVTADQDLITLASDHQALAKALAASAGKTQLLTGKQGAARSAFNTYIGQVATAATDAFTATGKTSSYNQIVRDSLPILEKAAGGNKALRREIRDLIATLKGGVTEKVFGTGSWSVTGAAGHLLPHHRPGGAAGMLVRGGTAGRDSVPIMAMPGEVLVPTHMVRAGAVDHLRGRLPGFGAGGVVGSYRDGVAGLAPWLATMNNQTLLGLERAVASATLAGIRAAQVTGGGAPPGSTGPGAAAAQSWMRAHLADYGWGASVWPSLVSLWNGESGWSATALNRSMPGNTPWNAAYGIPQSDPGVKMAALGADWLTNPVTQMRWGAEYIRGVYGNPATAYSDWLSRSPHWYGAGLDGIFSRRTLIGVGDRGPEHVQVTPAGRGGQPVRIVLSLARGRSPLEDALLKAIRFEVRDKGGGDVQAAFGG